MAGAQLAPPIALADRLWGHWRRLSPWVKLMGVPLGALAARKFVGARGGGLGKGKLATLAGVLPVVIEAWKAFREFRRGAKV